MLDVEQASVHNIYFSSQQVPTRSCSQTFTSCLALSLLSLQVFLVTVVSSVIGTCPTQMAASPVTATPSVPSARSVSRGGGSVSVNLAWEVGAVILVAEVLMV